MRIYKLFSTVIALSVVTGCTGINKDFRPVSIKEDAETSEFERKSDKDKDIALRCQSTFNAAREGDGNGTNIKNFLEACIATIDLRCHNWLGRLADKEMKIDLMQKQGNTLADFGIGALNLGHPSADLMAALSSGKGAINSWVDKYEESFLVAPSSTSVQKTLTQAMDQAAKTIMDQAGTMSFISAYTTLRKYENICSPLQAKAILEESVNKTKVNVKVEGEEEKPKETAASATSAAPSPLGAQKPSKKQDLPKQDPVSAAGSPQVLTVMPHDLQSSMPLSGTTKTVKKDVSPGGLNFILEVKPK